MAGNNCEKHPSVVRYVKQDPTILPRKSCFGLGVVDVDLHHCLAQVLTTQHIIHLDLQAEGRTWGKKTDNCRFTKWWEHSHGCSSDKCDTLHLQVYRSYDEEVKICKSASLQPLNEQVSDVLWTKCIILSSMNIKSFKYWTLIFQQNRGGCSAN